MKNVFILVAIAIFSFGCKTKTISYTVTDEEAKKLAKQIEESIKAGDASVLDNAISRAVFIPKIDIPNSQKMEEETIFKKMDIGKKIIESLGKSGNYEIVKLMEKNKKKYLIFRIYSEDGINYQEMELCKEDNEVKIADIFVYLSGENLSETIKSLLKTIAKGQDFNDSEKEYLDAFRKQMPEIKRLIKEEKYTEAENIYIELPENLKNNKTFAMYNVIIAQGLNDEKYNKALNQYKKLSENLTNLDLLLIDGFLNRGDYDKALDCVNRLDNHINKDPFLDFFRYLIFNMKKDKKNALLCIEKAAIALPQHQVLQLELIATYKEDNEKDKLTKVVETYKANKVFDQERLEQILNK
jgi:tetratricopeptide (TPR) repeat protein